MVRWHFRTWLMRRAMSASGRNADIIIFYPRLARFWRKASPGVMPVVGKLITQSALPY